MDAQSDKPNGTTSGPAKQTPARPVGTPPPAQARQMTQQEWQRAGEDAAQRPTQPMPTQRWSLSVAIAVVVLLGAIAVGAVLLVSGHGNGLSPRPALGPDAAGAISPSGSDTDTAPGEGSSGSETVRGSGSAGEEGDTGTGAAGGYETGTSTTGTTGEEANTGTSSTSNGVLPAVPGEQMQSEIQQMLLSWHEDVVAGNYRGAWELLSHRKQQQDEREYGYTTWVKNQSTLRPYLNPSGLQVSVEHVESGSGVAQVNVTGMGWDKPGAPCTEWSGITWVKYEDGGWKYDPGYSTTPQREREFKSRYSELLGGKC
jgi:hypothetical protein